MNDEQTAAEHNAFLAALLGGGPAPSEPAAPDDAPPDFDGGARETPLEPENPEADHTELIGRILGDHRQGGQWAS